MKMLRSLLLTLVLILSFTAVPAMAQDAPPPPDSSSMSLIQMSGIGDVDNPPFAVRKQQAKTALENYECWPCKIFNSFLTGMFRAIEVADEGSASLVPVLTGFATVFSLFYLGSAFVSGDASDLLGRWQVFWRLCIAVAAASIILQLGAAKFLWNNVYSLIFMIGTAAANAFGSASVGGNCPAVSAVGSMPAGAVEAAQSMSATVCGGYFMTIEGMAMGWAVGTQVDGIINSMIFGVAGILLIAIYALLALTFPLRFIDVLLKLAIVSLITPILVVAAVFKPTRGYASIAISNVLNATALFAIVSIIFRIGSVIMEEFLLNSAAGSDNVSNNIFSGNAIGVDVLISSIILVAVALTFLGMLKSAPSIAAELSRSSGGSSSAGDAATSAAVAPVKIVAGGAGLAAGAGAAGMMRNAAAVTRGREAGALASQIGGSVASAIGKNAR